jgi:hypothetical protein
MYSRIIKTSVTFRGRLFREICNDPTLPTVTKIIPGHHPADILEHPPPPPKEKPQKIFHSIFFFFLMPAGTSDCRFCLY